MYCALANTGIAVKYIVVNCLLWFLLLFLLFSVNVRLFIVSGRDCHSLVFEKGFYCVCAASYIMPCEDESRPSFSVVPQWRMDTVRGRVASCGWALLLAVDLKQMKIIFSLGNTSLLDPTWSESSKATLQQVFLGHHWGCLLDISDSPPCRLSHDRRGPYGCFQPESWVKRMWHFQVETFSFKTLQVQ